MKNNIYNDIQKRILSMLTDKIEKSKTYIGKEQKQQHFYVTPEQVIKNYTDYADSEEKQIKFYLSVSELEKKGLVSVQYYDSTRVYRIYALLWRYHTYCNILGRMEKFKENDHSVLLFQRFASKSELLNQICMEQYYRILNNKKISIAKNLNDLENILKLIFVIEKNTSEMMERELSILFFSDSKRFEKEYRTRIGMLFIKHGNYSFFTPNMTKKEMIDAVYSHHLIVKNPTYIHFKGDGYILFKDGFIMNISASHPTSVLSKDLKNIKEVHIRNKQIMTIENLTTFNRMENPDICFVYLNGYSNFAKRHFLQKINEDNPSLKWYHFGDIDPDGFMIAYCLERDTGIHFHLYKMSEKDLESYSFFAKRLTDKDKQKAKKMIQDDIFKQNMMHMLTFNFKLEQEIISWDQFHHPGRNT